LAKLLTAIAVAAIKPGSARLEIRDTGSPGTGLFLHVQAKGKDGKSGGGKSWVMLIRTPDPAKPGTYRSHKLWLGPSDPSDVE
jgi:hypothetical protein